MIFNEAQYAFTRSQFKEYGVICSMRFVGCDDAKGS